MSKIPATLGANRIVNVAGEGQFAKVYLAKEERQQTPKGASSYRSRRSTPKAETMWAVKQLKQIEDLYVEREIEILRRVKHPNIIALKEVFRFKARLHLVFEYAQTDLLKLLDHYKSGLPSTVVKTYSRQLLRALAFCHHQAILHRDVKPENLLLCAPENEKLIPTDTKALPRYSLKLCDFGCARVAKKIHGRLSGYIATRWYRAPELLQTSAEAKRSSSGRKNPRNNNACRDKINEVKKSGARGEHQGTSRQGDIERPDVAYGSEVDIWAAGCVIGEMALGHPLFPGSSDADQLERIKKGFAPLTSKLKESIASNGYNFLEKLLAVDGRKRPTAASAICHPYLQQQQLTIHVGNLVGRSLKAGGRDEDIAEEVESVVSMPRMLENTSLLVSPGSVASTVAEYGSEFYADTIMGGECVGLPDRL